MDNTDRTPTHAALRRIFARLPVWAWIAVGALVAGALLVIGRSRPSTNGTDQGDYLTIAARLAHGAHMYTGVWDNKAPLFYYAQAAEYLVAGWRGPFLADIAWLTVATTGMALLLREAGTSRTVTAVTAIAYPVMLTGGWYTAGSAELAFMAPATLVAYLWLGGRRLVTGIALGLLPFFAPQLIPIYLGLLIAVTAARRPARDRLRGIAVRLVGGITIGAAAAIAWLGLRGELVPFIDAMRGNLKYPDTALSLEGGGSGFRAHLRAVERSLFHDHVRESLFWLMLAIGIGLVIAVYALRRRQGRRTDAWDLLVAMTGVTLLTTLATLGSVALWTNHVDYIALPAALLLATAIAAIERLSAWHWVTWPAIAVVVAIAVYGSGGILRNTPMPFTTTVTDWVHAPRSATAIALNTAARIVAPNGQQVTYARVGGGDDGSGAFTASNVTLTCPIFFEFYFSHNMPQAYECLVSRRPELIAVGPLFIVRSSSTWRPLWNPFVTDVRALLTRNYTVISTALDHAKHGTPQRVVVWRLRGSAGGR